MNPSDQKQDIPAGVAVAMLVALVGAWLYFRAPTAFVAIFQELDRYSDQHWALLSVLLFATTINGVWIGSFLAQVFSLNRQGKRLEILTKQQNKRHGNIGIAWRSIVIGVAGSIVLYSFFGLLPIGSLPSFIVPRWENMIYALASCDFGFSLYVISSLLERADVFASLFGRAKSALPELPHFPNAIVLGSEEV